MNRVRAGAWHLKHRWDGKPYKLWRLFGVVLIAGIVLSLLYVLAISENSNRQVARTRFNSAIQTDVDNLQNQFEVYADTLYSGRALHMTESNVSNDEWKTFIAAQDISQRYPGVSAISYIDTSDRNQIAFLSPQLDAARDTGTPRISQPLQISGDSPGTPPSFMIVMPVYDSGSTIATLAGRRTSIEGYVVMSLRSKAMLDAIFQAVPTDEKLAISASANGHNVYQSGTMPALHGSLRRTVPVYVAGQTWQFVFAAPGSFDLSTFDVLGPTILAWTSLPMIMVLLVAFYLLINLKTMRMHHRVHHSADSDHEHN